MGEIERCPDVETTFCPSFCEVTTNDPPRCWNSDQYDWQDTAITVVNGPTDPGVTKYPVGPKKLKKGIANHLVCYDVYECSCSIDLNTGLYLCWKGDKCGAGTLLRLVRDTEECVVVEDPNGEVGPGNP